MNRCPFEHNAAVAPMTDPELRAHVADCPVCSEIARVAAAFAGTREDLVRNAELPDAGRVWLRAQIRAKQEAIRNAGRPITAAQVIAFGAAMGLIGACFGATSTLFQAFLRWAGEVWAGVDKSAWVAGAAAFLAGNVVLVSGIVFAVLVLPAAVYLALQRE